MAKYLDINGLNRFLDKIKGLLNLKADKTDTYTKSEVDALVAEGGGGNNENNSIAIPADTYTMEIDGKIYYALSCISAKKMALYIDYYDRYANICNGFAFTTNSKDVTFNITSENYREDVGEIYMHLNPEGKRYQIYDDSGDYDFTKSAERKFHTLYWDSEMIKFDLKKIVDCGTELAEKRSIFVSISSEEEVKIINYGKCCAPLFAKPDGRPNRFEIYSYSEEGGLFLVTNCDATQVKLHFCNYLPYALPKHENAVVTNNSIKNTYYPNPVYFVRTDKMNSCFDFIGFEDGQIERLESIFVQINKVTRNDCMWYKTTNRVIPFCSVKIHGDMSTNNASMSIEEPNIPILKKNYTYNNRLIYTGIHTGSVFGNIDHNEVRLYRYRRNSNKYKSGRPIKYRKLNNRAAPTGSVFGDYDVFKLSKTGVKSSVSTKIRVSITDAGLKIKKIGGS